MKSFIMIGFGYGHGRNIIFSSNEYSSSMSFAIIAMYDVVVRDVSNRWNGIWNGMVERKMDWNGECS